MRVMHVLAPGGIGGLERVVQMLAAGQHHAGHDVRVACVLAGVAPEVGARFTAPLAEAGIPAHSLTLPPRGYRRERALVAELCRRHRPDVVHTHGMRSDVADAPVARALRVATVSTVHGHTGGGLKVRCYEALQRRALRRFDAVVAVARPLGLRLARAGVPLDRLHVIPNAWGDAQAPCERAAARRILGLPRDAFVVGWVGRLSPEKGLDVLLDALAVLADASLHAAVLGDGPAREPLQSRARRLGLGANVHWTGAVPGAGRLFRAFDVYALSSRTEGTPIALLEAAAAGVPVVATRVGGVPDVLTPREAALVPPENPAALAAALRDVRWHPAAAACRAEAAAERLARDFGAGPWVRRYDAAYEAALATRRR